MMMDKNYYQTECAFFKALNHPVRLAILDVLRKDEACVCHLEAVLGQRQAYISQQLAVLREAGMIQDRRDGWNIYYQVTDRKIFELVDLARQIVYKGQEYPLVLEPKKCPCPKCNSNENEIKLDSVVEKKIYLKESKMLTIKVLGSGCPNCKKVEAVTRKVVETLAVEATIEKVTDYYEIMKFDILATPGLVINDKVVSYGRIPSESEVTTWVTSAL